MDAPDNRHLVDAIAAVNEAHGDALEQHLRSLLDALVTSTLFAGDDDGLVALETDDGGLLLALFTDKVELHFFAPGCPAVEIQATEAIKRVAAEEFEGLVINPGRHQFELTREDVLDFFVIDD